MKSPLFFSALLLVLFVLGRPSTGNCQSDSATQKAITAINQVSDKMLKAVEKKYSRIGKKIAAYNKRTLEKLQGEEQKLNRAVSAKDSTAKLLPASGYTALLEKVQHPVASGASLNDYMPRLDSLQSTFRFFEQAGAKFPGVPADKLQQVQALSQQLKNLQSQLNAARDIKKFVKERQAALKAQLEQLGMTGQLKEINKQAYYYQQQVNEYKELIKDPAKLEKKLLSLAREMPAFNEFFRKNSLLAQLFPAPAGYGTAAALQGLQTRSAVQQQLTSQLGAAGAGGQQYLQQQVNQAQSQMNALKDKINKLGGGSSELVMPDFKPNSQKTKSFWNRIEYGLNIQSQKTNALLPVTSDVALTAGYKLNDKSTIGIGAGYKIGWGKNISNIKITSEGVSLRSFIDVKLKGSFWLTGGYEENYQQAFTNIEQLKNANAWQQSGLLGLSKKYKIGKKNGNLQLLWDFLSYSQVPRTQAIKFRVGYCF